MDPCYDSQTGTFVQCTSHTRAYMWVGPNSARNSGRLSLVFSSAVGILVPSIVALVIIAVSFCLRKRRDQGRLSKRERVESYLFLLWSSLLELQQTRLSGPQLPYVFGRRVKRATESDVSQSSSTFTTDDVNDRTPPYTHPTPYHSRNNDQFDGTAGVLQIVTEISPPVHKSELRWTVIAIVEYISMTRVCLVCCLFLIHFGKEPMHAKCGIVRHLRHESIASSLLERKPMLTSK